MSGPRLLLAGCGHAHLFVLEALARGRLPGVRATLVSPAESYFYSGMIPGVLAGRYAPEQARLRPPRLARAAGAEWVRGSVARVDAHAWEVTLADGRALGYDLLSLDVGSALAADDLPGVAEHALPVKPMQEALRIASAAEAAVERLARRQARIVVAGGGPAGVEVALCLGAGLARRSGGRFVLTLLEAGDALLAGYPEAFRERAAGVLRGRGVEVRTGTAVERVEAGEVRTGEGAAVPFDVLVWATGPRAPSLFRDSNLPTDGRGYLRVGPTLQAVGNDDVFAAGDCAALEGAPWVAKAGVYAVREGEALPGILESVLAGRDPEPYRPQRDWLSLMNTGDGRALLAWRGLVEHGRAAWLLKDSIDRRFMRRFRRLER